MMRVFVLTLALAAWVSHVVWAQEAPRPPLIPQAAVQQPAAPRPSSAKGRYVFYPAQTPGGLEYLLDTATGDLWIVSLDPETNYKYLGFVPKGPTFSFEDILRQKQHRRPLGQ